MLRESEGRACIGLGYCWLLGLVSEGVKEAVDSQGVFQCMSDFILNG